MNKKRIAINMVAQIISFIINVGINLVLTPFITVHVGKEVYGYVNLAFQTTGYITIITTALNAMLGRYVTIKISQKDYESANIYFTSVTLANIVISLVLIAPSVFFLLFLEKIINIPSAYILDVKLLWAFIMIGFIVNLAYETYGVATYASNRLDLGAKRGIESNFIKVVILVSMFLMLDPKIWYIGFATFSSGVFVFITNKYYLNKLLPQIKLERKYFRWSAVKELVILGTWNSINQIAQSLINGMDMILTNLYIGAAEMTIMGFAKAMPIYILSLIGIVSNSFAPQMTMIYASGDMNEFVKKTKQIMNICGFLCSVPMLGFIAFGSDFFHIWLPTLNTKEVNMVQLLSVMTLSQTILDVYIFPLYTVNAITCKLKIPVLVNLLIGILNVAGTLLLLKTTNLGIYAIQIVSSTLLCSRVFFFAPIYAAHTLKIKLTTFYPQLLKGVIASSVILTIYYLLGHAVHIDNWFKLIMIAIFAGIIGYLVNFILIFKNDERKKMIKILSNKLNRI